MITKQDRRMGWPPWYPAVHDVNIEFRKMDFEEVDPHRPLGLTAARAPAPLPEEARPVARAFPEAPTLPEEASLLHSLSLQHDSRGSKLPSWDPGMSEWVPARAAWSG